MLRVHDHAMHVVPRHRKAVRPVLGAHAVVRGAPGRARVDAAVHAARRHRHDEMAGIVRVDADRVQREQATGRLPSAARRVLVERRYVPPARAAVVAREQARRIDARVKRAAVRRPREMPDRLQRLGMASRRMLRRRIEAGPVLAAVVAAVDVRTPHGMIGGSEQFPRLSRRHHRVQDAVAGKVRAVDLPRARFLAQEQAEQAFFGAHQQRGPGCAPAGSRGHFSLSRGISSTRLQGRVRASSCAAINSSQAVAQAPEDPGTQNT